MVTDFGVARRLGAGTTLSPPGAIVGTAGYMPPEQAAPRGALTISADVYALRAVLYELLTGRPPFHADSPLETLAQVLENEPEPPRSRNTQIDRDLETVCLTCLRKQPERRYASAEALADDLQRWLDHEPIRARPATRWERAVKWVRRRPAIAALAAVSTAAAAALLIGGLVFNARLNVRSKEVAGLKTDLEGALRRVDRRPDAGRALGRRDRPAGRAAAEAARPRWRPCVQPRRPRASGREQRHGAGPRSPDLAG
jgi:serine/threonine-protein kinase